MKPCKITEQWENPFSIAGLILLKMAEWQPLLYKSIQEKSRFRSPNGKSLVYQATPTLRQ